MEWYGVRRGELRGWCDVDQVKRKSLMFFLVKSYAHDEGKTMSKSMKT